MHVCFSRCLMGLFLFILRAQVRLGDFGWKDRYYKEKFSAESSGEIENLRKEIVRISHGKFFLVSSEITTLATS